MTRNIVAGVAAVGLIFYLGRLSRPGDDELPAQLVAARATSDSLKRIRLQDSLALAAAKRMTDQAIRSAQLHAADARRASLVARAYRDSARILNDTAVVVTSPTGVVDTNAVPVAITERMRADSATIERQAVALQSMGDALTMARLERERSDRANATAVAEIDNLRARIPLERAAEYARGKRAGRRQGIVLGSIGTFTVVFGGVKIVQAAK